MGVQIPHVFPHGEYPIFPMGFPMGETLKNVLAKFIYGFPHGGNPEILKVRCPERLGASEFAFA